MPGLPFIPFRIHFENVTLDPAEAFRRPRQTKGAQKVYDVESAGFIAVQAPDVVPAVQQSSQKILSQKTRSASQEELHRLSCPALDFGTARSVGVQNCDYTPKIEPVWVLRPFSCLDVLLPCYTAKGESFLFNREIRICARSQPCS